MPPISGQEEGNPGIDLSLSKLAGPEEALAFLRGIFASVRNKAIGLPHTKEDLHSLVAQMRSQPDFAEDVSRAVAMVLQEANLVPLLTDSGMALSRSLSNELMGRIRHKILPPLQAAWDFRSVLHRIFPNPDDHRWVAGVGKEGWSEFFSQIQMAAGMTRRMVVRQVLYALEVLSVRLSHLGTEPEVSSALPAAMNRFSSPFLIQQHRLTAFLQAVRSGSGASPSTAAAGLRDMLSLCSKSLLQIREQIGDRGTSVGQTFILYQAEHIVERMYLLLDTVDGNGKVDTILIADHFIRVVRNEKMRYSLRAFLSQTTGQLAYQIAEQKGRRGDEYITSSRPAYAAMIGSAMKGGLIISFVALFKNLLSQLSLPPFWQGLFYSLNYSAGFVAIDQTGATLATKQPAYTANAVAGSIDYRRSAASDPSALLVANLVKVSRSQFASFIGNLLVVFPGTWLLAALWEKATGGPLASGEKAFALLADQHPFQSLSLLYACNTGVCLFLSGLIAGYVQNRMRYSRIGERIIEHPGLSRTLRDPARIKLARFADRHAGALAGSIALGFMLGMAGMIGKFFGIPFDIRHITISAGNLSIGLYGLGWEGLPHAYLLTVLLGVLAIGFLNFIVSFSLAFYVALRSRGLHLQDVPRLLRLLTREFLRRPFDFIRPPRGD